METLQHMLPKDSLTKSEIISGYLQHLALPSMFNRILNESDYELWDSVLTIYSRAAIRFSFDNWITSGKKFPLPSDITPLCISYQEQEEQANNPTPKRGQRLEGGNVQLLALFDAICDRRRRFEQAGKTYQPLSDNEIDVLVQAARNGTLKASTETRTHFDNGNPVYNRELTQARALLRKPRAA